MKIRSWLLCFLSVMLFWGCSTKGNEDAKLIQSSLKDLQGKENSLRLQAIKTLGDKGDATAIAPLLDIMEKDADETIRCHAIAAVGCLGKGHGPAKAALMKKITLGTERERSDAIAVLMKMEKEAVLPEILQVLENEKSDKVKYYIFTFLTGINDTRVIPPISRFLLKGSDFEKASAAVILGNLKDISTAGVLIDAARDKNAGVRQRAIWALGNIKAISALSALREALKDINPEVAAMAKAAIANIEKT